MAPCWSVEFVFAHASGVRVGVGTVCVWGGGRRGGEQGRRQGRKASDGEYVGVGVVRAFHKMVRCGVTKAMVGLLPGTHTHTHTLSHGPCDGLQAVKYILAVRRDIVTGYLRDILPVLVRGLQDGDDDVRAAAAESLLPIVDTVTATHAEAVPAVVCVLWDTLHDLDDLTVSTSAIMRLLASLLAFRCDASYGGEPLVVLVPRLWPFFRHTLQPVRLAVIESLRTLVHTPSTALWLGRVADEALRLTYQNLLVEARADVQAASEQVRHCSFVLCSERPIRSC